MLHPIQMGKPPRYLDDLLGIGLRPANHWDPWGSLVKPVRRKVFISYHDADTPEVRLFIERFGVASGTFISRGIGAGMAGDIIDSNNTDYVMSRIRSLYLQDSTVTIVLIGNCTWARKYVDWEIKASLRSGETATPNGLLGVKLPSFTVDRGYPRRLNANLLSKNENDGIRDCYARVVPWPDSVETLRERIEDAYRARTARRHLINNSRDRFLYNRDCGHYRH